MRLPSLLVLASGLLCTRADLFDDIVSTLTTATNCSSCHANVLPPLQTLSRQGDAAFVQTMTAVCEALKLADDAVCAGEMQLSGPVLAHSLRGFTVNGTTATKFCDAVFGLCQPPPVTPFNVTFPKPAPSNPKTFASRGRPAFQVVHLSDVHVDRRYTVGAEANCDESICCRATSSHSGNTTEPAGPFGNARCDSPVDLAESLLCAVDTIAPSASFTILTGDVVERDTWQVNRSEVTVDLEAWNSEMLQGLRAAVYPAIEVIQFPSDTAPVNAFARDVTQTPNNSQWVFDIESVGWEHWVGSEAAGEVHAMSGSYSVRVPEMNLRILSVNTQYWYKQNFWLYDRDEQIADPNGLLAFMVEQLQIAEDLSQRVWIIGHIPSGKADTAHDQSNYYDQIVQRYKNTIAAQFFGHSHKDQFEIAYSDWNNRTAATADSILFIGPALTPQSGNPAFKLYDVDPDTYEVMDMKVFITNISDPGFQTSPAWQLYYSARESYGPLVETLGATHPLDASFWHSLTEAFMQNDTAFQLWNARQSRGVGVSPCTGVCKTTTICDMQSARSESNCDVSTPGVSLKRSEATAMGLSGTVECEGGRISSILKAFLAQRSL